MEVTPELYAWLADLNIINPFSSLKSDVVGSFIIPEKTVQLMIGGKYMDVILTKLQSAYNKFYKLKLDYLTKLKDLKPISDDQDYVSNSIKYANWHLINEMLNQFGISYTEDQINKVINGDREYLLKVITQVYYLCNQFLKHSDNDETKKPNQSNPKSTEKEITKEKEKPINIETKTAQLDKFILSDNENEKENDTNKVKNKKSSSDAVNINNIDPNKTYEECTSALEFFILSLCKNLDMKPRQAVALLSNNRKYLSLICTKGIKGDFSKINKWLRDIALNYEIMMRLVNSSDDGLNVGFSTIGAALICQDPDIPVLSAQLLDKINLGNKMNWDWFKSEGIDSMIYAIIKQEEENGKLTLLNALYDFSKEKINDFFLEIRKKLAGQDKKTILEFLSCLLPYSKKINSFFAQDLKNLIFEVGLNEQEDLSCSVSLISNAFYYFSPIDDALTEKTIDFYKKCIRNNSQNVYSTAVAQIFSLMEKFGKTKSKSAPALYKSLVFLFLENYDKEEKRQYILENFEKFFNNQQQIPIDIFLEPYIDQLNNSKNYTLCDFDFLFRMIEHPRIESKTICLLLKFLLEVSLHNENYSRSANLILGLIFEKDIINKKCTPEDYEKVAKIFVDYIHKAIYEYMKNIKTTKKKDKEKSFLLETPYDILSENFNGVNFQVYDNLVKAVKSYRKIKKHNSNGLLAMLWFYPDHDDLLLNIEEENRPIYEPIDQIMKKKLKVIKDTDKKNYPKQLQNFIGEVKNRRLSQIEIDASNNLKQKKKEDKMKKEIEDQRKISRLMSGADGIEKPPILTEPATVSLPIIQETKFNMKSGQPKEETYAETSNLLKAINSATQKYINKGALTNASMTDNSAFSGGNKKLKNNYIIDKDSKSAKKTKFSEIHEKKSDDVIEKYGKIVNVDILKKKEEAMKEYKMKIRLHSIKNYILPEGTLIKILPNGGQEVALMDNIQKYRLSHEKNPNSTINLEEEEDREIKAIDGYKYAFRKNLKFYFKSYSSESRPTIKKNNLLKMIRDKGIKKDRLNLEELNNLIRNLYNENLEDINFEQFSNILVHLSFFIFTKIRPTMTIGESYGNLIKRFNLPEETDTTQGLKKRMEPVINLLKEKKENDKHYNMPEGFKFAIKTEVKYNNRLPPHFIDIIGESKYICYELIEELIFNIFHTSIIEPYVNLDTVEDVILEPDKIHRWSPKVTMTYIEMDKEYQKWGMIAADALEDGFRNYSKKIRGEKFTAPADKIVMQEYKMALKKEYQTANLLAQRQIEIKEDLDEYKQKREEIKKEKLNNLEILKEKNSVMISLHKRQYDEVIKRQKRKEEEKKQKLERVQQQNDQKKNKRMEELIGFYREERRKLKQLFKSIKAKRQEYFENFEKKDEVVQQCPAPGYFSKNQEYIDFETNLYDTIEELFKRDDIKQIFNKYDKHLKYIYDVYSKIGYNKISFFSKEVIRMNEFKQFLVNFTVLGLLISTDQMMWIFNKVATQKQEERDKQVYLDYHDFQLCIILLAIYSKYCERSRNLLPSDVDNTNGETIEYFIKFLGLTTPYNKDDMRSFINDRRALNMKALIDLQREMKNDVKGYKDGKYVNKEELKRKEEKKKKMQKLRKKKEMERENDDESKNSDEKENEGDNSDNDKSAENNNDKSNDNSKNEVNETAQKTGENDTKNKTKSEKGKENNKNDNNNKPPNKKTPDNKKEEKEKGKSEEEEEDEGEDDEEEEGEDEEGEDDEES